MGTIMLDTSAVIEILQDGHRKDAVIGAVADQLVRLPSFTVFELLRGPATSHEKVMRLLERIPVVAFDRLHAEKAADLKKSLQPTGRSLADIDLFIASLAMVEGCQLVTCDRDFEKVPGLSVKVF